MKETIAWWALAFSVVSFGLYAAMGIVQVIAQFRASMKVLDGAQPTDTVPDITKPLTAIKELVDALSKASPTLVALIAALAFMVIAGLVSGSLGAG